MAKTKKEMRRMMGHYADIIVRYKQRLKRQEELMQGWTEVSQLNQAMVAALILRFSEDESVEIKSDTLAAMLMDYKVLAALNEDGDGYVLKLLKTKKVGG